ncbi:unnamed protein product [Rotaria sp. Silwood1]|nr:unnamed protein product [Rotaria sp. Silwood1]
MLQVNSRLASYSTAHEPKQFLKPIKGYEKEPLLSLEKAFKGQLWCGVKEDLTELYPKGTSTDKNINRHSYFKQEDEIILLLGTSLEIIDLINHTDGFHLINLHQVKLSNELLASPFNDTYKSKQYNSDDDSSADEASKCSYQKLQFQRSINQHNDVCKRPCSQFEKVIFSVQSSINQMSESIRIPKLQTQRSAQRRIEINYIARMGNYIAVQNTSNQDVQNMADYRVLVRILAHDTSKKSLAATPSDEMISLIADNIITCGIGTNMITQLIDDNEKQQTISTEKFL